MAADREKIRAFEELALVPAQTDLIAPETRALAARLDAILAVPLTVGLIMSLAPRDAPILQAVGRLLPPARLAALARSLLACPAACRKLAQLFPDDLLGTLGLPWLAEWEARRASPEGELQNWQMTLGVETDHFSVAGQNGQYVSFPYACTVLARRTVEPRRDVCIIATARNEGLYLLEWIAYHRAIGIEEFFLHTNDNDDGSDELLAALARGGAIHWIDSKVTPGVTSPQFKAYGHALAVRPEILDFRWALIVDLDEYMVLNPTRFSRVQDFLAWQEADPVDAIGLSWVFHGSGGHGKWRDDFIVRRFPNPVGKPRSEVKTLLRPRRFAHSWAHHPVGYRKRPYAYMDSSGNPFVPHPERGVPHLQNPLAEMAWINHYYYKSTEEFLVKQSRNRGAFPTIMGVTNTLLDNGGVHGFMDQFCRTGSALADPRQRRQVSMTSSLA